ncbi:putative transcriptional regulator [[Clostridium] ultunense Esp]|uniref:TetR/AcrR family transcriptional regulator n=1 Tax=Thermicanus aegyptius TaxID=94009 RepID=UPI0002B7043F|nr:TetR/AcrR family transcriptional regulator [Thermicanus aegyptius]CCQ96140.1 putative transcriptional regulator [[Clostridium] ultunense Esp]
MGIDRKAKILEAAKKTFSLFGYKATTMDQVASAANVGKGTIYLFFASKEELFNEIVQSIIEEIKEVARESFDPEKPFYENIHRAIYRVLDFRRNHELTIKLSQEVKEMRTPAAQEAMRKVEETVLSFLKGEIQKSMDKGWIKPCDPELTAFVILKLYIALIFEWEQNHEPLSKEKIAELFYLYFIKGLRTV